MTKRRSRGSSGEGRSFGVHVGIRLAIGLTLTVQLFLQGSIEWSTATLLQAVSHYVGYEPEQQVVSALGEHRFVQMPDGTRIELNTATSLTTNLAQHVRELTLDAGEILIDNTDEPGAPIRITASGLTLNLLRGRFTARRGMQGEYTVRVYEGSMTLVSASSGAGGENGAIRPPRLESGRSVVIRPGRAVVSRFSLEDASRFLSWTDGRLVFEGTPLSQAVVEFNRYNALKMEIGDPSLACVPIGGTFEATDVDGFVRAVSKLLKVDVVSEQRGASKVLVFVTPRWEWSRKRGKKPETGATECDQPGGQ